MLTSNLKEMFLKSKFLIFDFVVSPYLLRHAYSAVPFISSKSLVHLKATYTIL